LFHLQYLLLISASQWAYHSPGHDRKHQKIIGVVTNSISPFCEVGRIPRNRQFSAKFSEILQFLHQRLHFINTLKNISPHLSNYSNVCV